MRTTDRRTTTHTRIPASGRSAGAGALDARVTMVALALILLLGLAAVPLLSDGRVLDNLGAGLRSWAGVNR